MAVTPASFRAALNAFADNARYSDDEITYWNTLALKLHNADRWGDFIDDGVMFFIAHNLALEDASEQAAMKDQAPGAIQGAVTSVSVDKVSYARDPSAAMEPGAGHWNLTTYGMRWLRLSKMAGAGPLQIGAGPCGPNISSAAWPGPQNFGW